MTEENSKSIFSTDLLKTIREKLSWEDALFALVVASALVINVLLLSQLQQLPSPIYGGDYYNHLGSIEHIYQGGSLFESGQMLGEMQWVAWLYHLLVVIFAKIFGLTPMMGIIWFSLIAMIAGLTIVYLFVSKFFDNKLFGIIAVLWQLVYYPLFKYSPFAFYVILPLFLFAGYNFMKKPNYVSAILFGLSYGLAGLSTTYVFIEGTFILGFIFFYEIFIKNITYSKETKFKVDTQKLIHSMILAAIVFFIGFAISLLWWYEPIFVHHAKTANDMQIYGFPEIKGLGGMIGLVGSGIQNEFGGMGLSGLTYNTGFWLKRVMMLLGIICLVLVKKNKVEYTFLILLLLASAFGLCIHFITLPLLGTLMASTGLFQVGIMYSSILLALLTLKIILEYSNKAKGYLKHIGLVAILLVVVLILLGYSQQVKANQNDQWWKVGKSPLAQHLTQTEEWVKSNTELDDVFLTTNEDGFALNALTGRKVVTYRRTHASPYADLNQRMLDAGIMLYGSDNAMREMLLEKYSVDYLYWEPKWILNEFQIGPDGRISGIFDPLSADYTPEREALMRQANVTFARQQWYLDPAWLPSYPKRDLIVLLPARSDLQKPWHPSLDPYLELQKEIIENGQPVTRIYKINRKPTLMPAVETTPTQNASAQ